MQQSQPNIRSTTGKSGVPSSSGTIISNLSRRDNNKGITTTGEGGGGRRGNSNNNLNEESLCFALGLYRNSAKTTPSEYVSETGETDTSERRKLHHNPDAEKCDLSILRGLGNDAQNKQLLHRAPSEDTTDLKALAEIVPGLIDPATGKIAAHAPTNHHFDEASDDITRERLNNPPATRPISKKTTLDETSDINPSLSFNTTQANSQHMIHSHRQQKQLQQLEKVHTTKNKNDSVPPQPSAVDAYISSSSSEKSTPIINQENVYNNNKHNMQPRNVKNHSRQQHQHHIPSSSSVATISTHEIRLPMYLPTFKPATGCTNASDFIVRCFAARLRAGITVVKHGRSRWCKSRLRILHVHADGRSLTWKPAPGEPSSKSKPPKLDLSLATEVRHAWSPDPLFPMFTGTPILRQKCEAANAHKSFALIFPKRTVDITALTADQCKVLMEGFSALCFRLQVANLAHSRNKLNSSKTQKGVTTSNRDDEERSTTESNTLTNNSVVSRASHRGGSNRFVEGYKKNQYV